MEKYSKKGQNNYIIRLFMAMAESHYVGSVLIPSVQ